LAKIFQIVLTTANNEHSLTHKWFDNFLSEKTKTIFVSDVVKSELWKRFGKGFIENMFFDVITEWFKISHKYPVKEVI
jgi:hypothetical protein